MSAIGAKLMGAESEPGSRVSRGGGISCTGGELAEGDSRGLSSFFQQATSASATSKLAVAFLLGGHDHAMSVSRELFDICHQSPETVAEWASEG